MGSSNKILGSKKQRLKEAKTFPTLEIININLHRIDTDLKEYQVQSNFKGEALTDDGIRQVIESIIAPKKEKKVKYFADVLMKMIQDSEDVIRLKPDDTMFSESTIRAYKNTLWHIENFGEWRRKDLQPSELNKEFGEKLKEYFNFEEMMHNTKVKLLRISITAYNYAIEKGWMEASDFSKAKLKEETVDAIALTQEEVDTIFHLNLSADPALYKACDLLITGIWTLMRFSDYSTIEDYNIKGGIIKPIVR